MKAAVSSVDIIESLTNLIPW